MSRRRALVAAVARAYRRPPLSWTVAAFMWLDGWFLRMSRPVTRRLAVRRADQLAEVAAALAASHIYTREAAEAAALAARWYDIAGTPAARRR